jgi:hypothetical protein
VVLAAALTIGIVGSAVSSVKADEATSATITFCSKVGKSSGKLYGVAETFTLKNGKKVRGVIDLENVEPGRDLVVHVLWVKPNGKKAFKKRVELTPEESTARVQTSLSLSPDRRDPGVYRLKVYLFRMLLAETTVEIVSGEAESQEN